MKSLNPKSKLGQSLESSSAALKPEDLPKLLRRHKGQDFAVNWLNGSLTIYRKEKA